MEAKFKLFRSLVPTMSLLCLWGPLWAAPDENSPVCVIISGLGGITEHEENFLAWSESLETIFGDLGAQVQRFDGRSQRRQEILAAFDSIAADRQAAGDVWIFLVGHANYSRKQYKFNIKGPDLTDKDLKSFLDRLGNRRSFLVASTGSSGVLVEELGGERRVILAATRTARERYPPLFLSFFLESAAAAETDTDKDGRVSLLEAYLFSRKKVTDWFQDKGRIQTEHAVLDDGGAVRLGSSKDEDPPSPVGMLSSAAHLSSPPEKAYESLEARGLAQDRIALEREIEALKFRKSELPEADYYQELEALLLRLARINQRISELEGGTR